MKTAKKGQPDQTPVNIAQDELQAWEPLDDELWLPYRVRGSWRGGALG